MEEQTQEQKEGSTIRKAMAMLIARMMKLMDKVDRKLEDE